jgi:hypothetical protein
MQKSETVVRKVESENGRVFGAQKLFSEIAQDLLTLRMSADTFLNR